MYGAEHVDAAWYGAARRKDAHENGIHVLGIYQYLVEAQPAAAQAEVFARLVGALAPGEFARWTLKRARGIRSRAPWRGSTEEVGRA